MDFVPGMEEKYSARGIFSLPDKEFTALATLIGFSLIDHLTATQQNSLGNLFMTIGQILETSAIQQTLLETAARPGPCELQAQIDALQKRLDMLEGGGV